VLDHHRAQLLRCSVPDARIQKVLVVQKQKESIAEAALRGARNCDAVVVGTRGIGAVQNAMRRALGLGAVSNEVVHRSKVPVTVVPITTPVPEMITVRDGPRK
jgi:nucleotide-binding universal stress UspA family protein